MSRDNVIDPDIVHRIVVEDERMTNPYGEVETLVDKLERLKPYLIGIAQQGGYTTYMKTNKATGIVTARQSRVLGTLGLHEDELGLSLLPALVVQDASNPMPGEKYFNMVDATKNWNGPDSDTDPRGVWEEHVEKVRSYWSE